ncbi:MAG TPA: DUF881 domain-containing protein [Bacillota bacterium]|nr:DUF881 domain-containing protein [Bacillota bacterium]
MNKIKRMLLFTLVCIVLGFIIVLAFNSDTQSVELGGVTSVRKIEELYKERIDLEDMKSEQDDQIRQLQGAISQFEEEAAGRSKHARLINEDLLKTRAYAGLVALEGPGVEIVLNDRKRDTIIANNFNYFIVHDSDVLNVINELKSSGAEAISINGTRIMANSRISCGGPTINVGKYGRFAPPFVIQAIGDPDILAASFEKPESVYHDLIAWGLEFQIKKIEHLDIPRYLGDVELRFATTIRE